MTESDQQLRECPYVGLDYYREELGAWFFGREAERDRILLNLQAERLTLLYAASGAGKSSLLRAGVACRLRERALRQPDTVLDIPVVFATWHDNPVAALILELEDTITPFLGGRASPRLPQDHLAAATEIAAEAVNANLVFILDQFEEYALYSSQESPPQRFADELARCVNTPDLPANFLISIREDSYAGLGDLFKGRLANIYDNYLHINHLDRTAAEEAIRRPLEVYNHQPDITGPVSIQDELVDAVLDQVPAEGATGRVSTPLLQLVMETIWRRERATGSRELQLATLQHLQGVGKIVDTYLAAALKQLGPAERQTAIDMFEHLVTPSGSKIAESIPDLAGRTGHSEAQAGTVLGKLDKARIVRPVSAPPGRDPARFRRYEIYHDVLAPTINHQIARREEQRRIRARFRRWGVVGLALLLTVASLTVSWRYHASQDTSESRRLAVAAIGTASQDPQLSTVLALKALRTEPTPDAETALRFALPRTQAISVLRPPEKNVTDVTDVAFRPQDKNTVMAATTNGDVHLWNAKEGRVIRHLVPDDANKNRQTMHAWAVAFNPTGTLAAVGYGDGSVRLFDEATGQQRGDRGLAAYYPVTDLAFTGTSALLVTTRYDVSWWPLVGKGRLVENWRLTNWGANTVNVNPRNPHQVILAASDATDVCKLQPDSHVLTSCTPLGTARSLANDAAFNGSGTEVVTADRRGNAKVYRMSDPANPVMNLHAGEATATSAAFSQDGRWIAIGYDSGMVRIWNRFTGTQQTALAGNGSSVTATEFSRDGRQVVSGSDDGTARTWWTQPLGLRKEFYSGPSAPPVYSAEYSADGDRIMTMDSYGLAIYRASDWKILGRIKTTSEAKAATFDPSGTKIAVADASGLVNLWTTKPLHRIRLKTPIKVAAKDQIHTITFDRSGSRIVVTHDPGVADVFSIRTGKRILPQLRPNSGFKLYAAAFTPNGRQVLTADANGQVEVWNAATGDKIASLGKSGAAVLSLGLSRRGDEFVTTRGDGTVSLWSIDNRRKKAGTSSLWSIDNRRKKAGTASLWSIADRRNVWSAARSVAACSSPNAAAISPDHTRIVVGCGDGTIRVYTSGLAKLLTVLPSPDTRVVNTAVFSPNGRSILTTFGANGWDGNTTGGVQVWRPNLATLKRSQLEAIAAKARRPLTSAERETYRLDDGG